MLKKTLKTTQIILGGKFRLLCLYSFIASISNITEVTASQNRGNSTIEEQERQFQNRCDDLLIQLESKEQEYEDYCARNKVALHRNDSSVVSTADVLLLELKTLKVERWLAVEEGKSFLQEKKDFFTEAFIETQTNFKTKTPEQQELVRLEYRASFYEKQLQYIDQRNRFINDIIQDFGLRNSNLNQRQRLCLEKLEQIRSIDTRRNVIERENQQRITLQVERYKRGLQTKTNNTVKQTTPSTQPPRNTPPPTPPVNATSNRPTERIQAPVPQNNPLSQNGPSNQPQTTNVSHNSRPLSNPVKTVENTTQNKPVERTIPQPQTPVQQQPSNNGATIQQQLTDTRPASQATNPNVTPRNVPNTPTTNPVNGTKNRPVAAAATQPQIDILKLIKETKPSKLFDYYTYIFIEAFLAKETELQNEFSEYLQHLQNRQYNQKSASYLNAKMENIQEEIELIGELKEIDSNCKKRYQEIKNLNNQEKIPDIKPMRTKVSPVEYKAQSLLYLKGQLMSAELFLLQEQREHAVHKLKLIEIKRQELKEEEKCNSVNEAKELLKQRKGFYETFANKEEERRVQIREGVDYFADGYLGGGVVRVYKDEKEYAEPLAKIVKVLDDINKSAKDRSNKVFDALEKAYKDIADVRIKISDGKSVSEIFPITLANTPPVQSREQPRPETRVENTITQQPKLGPTVAPTNPTSQQNFNNTNTQVRQQVDPRPNQGVNPQQKILQDRQNNIPFQPRQNNNNDPLIIPLPPIANFNPMEHAKQLDEARKQGYYIDCITKIEHGETGTSAYKQYIPSLQNKQQSDFHDNRVGDVKGLYLNTKKKIEDLYKVLDSNEDTFNRDRDVEQASKLIKQLNVQYEALMLLLKNYNIERDIFRAEDKGIVRTFSLKEGYINLPLNEKKIAVAEERVKLYTKYLIYLKYGGHQYQRLIDGLKSNRTNSEEEKICLRDLEALQKEAYNNIRYAQQLKERAIFEYTEFCRDAGRQEIDGSLEKITQETLREAEAEQNKFFNERKLFLETKLNNYLQSYNDWIDYYDNFKKFVEKSSVENFQGLGSVGLTAIRALEFYNDCFKEIPRNKDQYTRTYEEYGEFFKSHNIQTDKKFKDGLGKMLGHIKRLDEVNVQNAINLIKAQEQKGGWKEKMAEERILRERREAEKEYEDLLLPITNRLKEVEDELEIAGKDLEDYRATPEYDEAWTEMNKAEKAILDFQYRLLVHSSIEENLQDFKKEFSCLKRTKGQVVRDPNEDEIQEWREEQRERLIRDDSNVIKQQENLKKKFQEKQRIFFKHESQIAPLNAQVNTLLSERLNLHSQIKELKAKAKIKGIELSPLNTPQKIHNNNLPNGRPQQTLPAKNVGPINNNSVEIPGNNIQKGPQTANKPIKIKQTGINQDFQQNQTASPSNNLQSSRNEISKQENPAGEISIVEYSGNNLNQVNRIFDRYSQITGPIREEIRKIDGEKNTLKENNKGKKIQLSTQYLALEEQSNKLASDPLLQEFNELLPYLRSVEQCSQLILTIHEYNKNNFPSESKAVTKADKDEIDRIRRLIPTYLGKCEKIRNEFLKNVNSTTSKEEKDMLHIQAFNNMKQTFNKYMESMKNHLNLCNIYKISVPNQLLKSSAGIEEIINEHININKIDEDLYNQMKTLMNKNNNPQEQNNKKPITIKQKAINLPVEISNQRKNEHSVENIPAQKPATTAVVNQQPQVNQVNSLYQKDLRYNSDVEQIPEDKTKEVQYREKIATEKKHEATKKRKYYMNDNKKKIEEKNPEVMQELHMLDLELKISDLLEASTESVDGAVIEQKLFSSDLIAFKQKILEENVSKLQWYTKNSSRAFEAIDGRTKEVNKIIKDNNLSKKKLNKREEAIFTDLQEILSTDKYMQEIYQDVFDKATEELKRYKIKESFYYEDGMEFLRAGFNILSAEVEAKAIEYFIGIKNLKNEHNEKVEILREYHGKNKNVIYHGSQVPEEIKIPMDILSLNEKFTHLKLLRLVDKEKLFFNKQKCLLISKASGFKNKNIIDGQLDLLKEQVELYDKLLKNINHRKSIIEELLKEHQNKQNPDIKELLKNIKDIEQIDQGNIKDMKRLYDESKKNHEECKYNPNLLSKFFPNQPQINNVNQNPRQPSNPENKVEITRVQPETPVERIDEVRNPQQPINNNTNILPKNTVPPAPTNNPVNGRSNRPTEAGSVSQDNVVKQNLPSNETRTTNQNTTPKVTIKGVRDITPNPTNAAVVNQQPQQPQDEKAILAEKIEEIKKNLPALERKISELERDLNNKKGTYDKKLKEYTEIKSKKPYFITQDEKNKLEELEALLTKKGLEIATLTTVFEGESNTLKLNKAEVTRFESKMTGKKDGAEDANLIALHKIFQERYVEILKQLVPYKEYNDYVENTGNRLYTFFQSHPFFSEISNFLLLTDRISQLEKYKEQAYPQLRQVSLLYREAVMNPKINPKLVKEINPKLVKEIDDYIKSLDKEWVDSITHRFDDLDAKIEKLKLVHKKAKDYYIEVKGKGDVRAASEKAAAIQTALKEMQLEAEKLSKKLTEFYQTYYPEVEHKKLKLTSPLTAEDKPQQPSQKVLNNPNTNPQQQNTQTKDEFEKWDKLLDSLYSKAQENFDLCKKYTEAYNEGKNTCSKQNPIRETTKNLVVESLKNVQFLQEKIKEFSKVYGDFKGKYKAEGNINTKNNMHGEFKKILDNLNYLKNNESECNRFMNELQTTMKKFTEAIEEKQAQSPVEDRKNQNTQSPKQIERQPQIELSKIDQKIKECEEELENKETEILDLQEIIDENEAKLNELQTELNKVNTSPSQTPNILIKQERETLENEIRVAQVELQRAAEDMEKSKDEQDQLIRILEELNIKKIEHERKVREVVKENPKANPANVPENKSQEQINMENNLDVHERNLEKLQKDLANLDASSKKLQQDILEINNKQVEMITYANSIKISSEDQERVRKAASDLQQQKKHNEQLIRQCISNKDELKKQIKQKQELINNLKNQIERNFANKPTGPDANSRNPIGNIVQEKRDLNKEENKKIPQDKPNIKMKLLPKAKFALIDPQSFKALINMEENFNEKDMELYFNELTKFSQLLNSDSKVHKELMTKKHLLEKKLLNDKDTPLEKKDLIHQELTQITKDCEILNQNKKIYISYLDIYKKHAKELTDRKQSPPPETFTAEELSQYKGEIRKKIQSLDDLEREESESRGHVNRDKTIALFSYHEKLEKIRAVKEELTQVLHNISQYFEFGYFKETMLKSALKPLDSTILYFDNKIKEVKESLDRKRQNEEQIVINEIKYLETPEQINMNENDLRERKILYSNTYNILEKKKLEITNQIKKMEDNETNYSLNESTKLEYTEKKNRLNPELKKINDHMAILEFNFGLVEEHITFLKLTKEQKILYVNDLEGKYKAQLEKYNSMKDGRGQILLLPGIEKIDKKIEYLKIVAGPIIKQQPSTQNKAQNFDLLGLNSSTSKLATNAHERPHQPEQNINLMGSMNNLEIITDNREKDSKKLNESSDRFKGIKRKALPANLLESSKIRNPTENKTNIEVDNNLRTSLDLSSSRSRTREK